VQSTATQPHSHTASTFLADHPTTSHSEAQQHSSCRNLRSFSVPTAAQTVPLRTFLYVILKTLFPHIQLESVRQLKKKQQSLRLYSRHSVRQLTAITVKILGARLQAFFWDCLLTGPTGCLETSVNNYRFTLRNIPEERRSNI
jgi:hypothetical protein